MELNDRALAELLDFDDEIGVLTVTMGFVNASDDGQAARIEWKNRLRDLRNEVDGDARAALDRRVDELSDEFEALLDPRATGQGRALVVGLGSGEVVSFRVQTPFEDRAVIRERPYLRPLVAALDEGRPAGIVIATKSGARVLEWSASTTRELSEHDFELTDAQLADERGGPVAANPARGQQTVSHREAFDDRIDANRDRFLKEVAGVVAEQAADRGWDRVVVAGSGRIRDRVRDLLADDGIAVLDVDEHWEDRSVGQVASVVWPVLRSNHSKREQELTARIRDLSMSGGQAVMGAKRVTGAANLGRISHLAFAHDTRLDGYVGVDGTLHAELAGPEAQQGMEMTPTPHLVERLVERVLSTGGRVTRLDDEDANRDLAAYQGLGALLRW